MMRADDHDDDQYDQDDHMFHLRFCARLHHQNDYDDDHRSSGLNESLWIVVLGCLPK